MAPPSSIGSSVSRLSGAIGPTGAVGLPADVFVTQSRVDYYVDAPAERTVWDDVADIAGGVLCLGTLGILCMAGCGGEGYNQGQPVISVGDGPEAGQRGSADVKVDSNGTGDTQPRAMDGSAPDAEALPDTTAPVDTVAEGYDADAVVDEDGDGLPDACGLPGKCEDTLPDTVAEDVEDGADPGAVDVDDEGLVAGDADIEEYGVADADGDGEPDSCGPTDQCFAPDADEDADAVVATDDGGDVVDGGDASDILCLSKEMFCNGLDDDCNGVTDDFAEVGMPCAPPDAKGVCLTSGVLTCDPVQSMLLFCNAPVVKPADKELCNGKDDTCDGAADEGFDVGADCSDGVGVCKSDGKKVCTNDQLSTKCNAVAGLPAEPSETKCDGLDNDCNGKADDIADIGKACTIGAGICVSNGKLVCDPLKGPALFCDAAVIPPGVEACNGLDDDCDGKVDEVEDGLADNDKDAICDEKDPDDDNDNVADVADNCQLVANPGQEDFNVNGKGDACDDTDGDGVMDAKDNCKTVANPGQEAGTAPNGLACTPKCAAVQNLYKIQEGETALLQFTTSAAETFECEKVGKSFADPQKQQTVDVAVTPTVDTVYDKCKVTGYGLSVFCSAATVDVNHKPVIKLVNPADKQVGVLPTGDQWFKSYNNITFDWEATDSDKDNITCLMSLFQGGNKVVSATPTSGPGPLFGSALSADKLQPRSDYCWSVDCDDGVGGITSTGAQYCFTTSDKGLVGWWRFEEGSGVVAKDTSGGGHDGALMGAAVFANNSLGGGALKLDGSGASMDVSDVETYNFGGTNFTLAAWIKPATTTAAHAIIEHRTPSNGYELMRTKTEKLAFYGASCGTIAYADALPIGVWRHVSVTRTAGAINLFVNGALMGTGICSDNFSNPAIFRIGCNTVNIECVEPFDGLIDDVIVYNRAATPGEIATLATSPPK